MKERVNALRAALREQELDALIVSEANSRRYLSGFTGSAGVLVITRDEQFLVTDFRYFEQVAQQAPDWELVQVERKLDDMLAKHIGKLDVERVGFESHVVPVKTYRKWKETMPNVDLVATSGLVEELRQVKSPEELAAIKKAVEIADQALMHAMDWMHPGITERELSWELEVHMRTHGAEALAFTSIVAAGPNSAMSHAVTTDRVIEAGDPIVIDMGAMYDGYRSDMTRSFCMERASDRYLEIWNVVLEAQETAEAEIKAGMSGVEADRIARDIIYAAGYEGKFEHGLGHGVGLAIHEAPRASRTAQGTLKDNVILTVEPGIYLPGWGGIRIEDTVLVTTDGCEILTQTPKSPVVS